MEPNESSLSQVQLAEIKKAFAIFDKDGSGSIDKAELKELVASITDETPSDDEISKIMLAVDKDRSGRIEWTEFMNTMGQWIGEFSKSKGGLKRKAQEHTEVERQDVHKKIKSFFQQFKQDPQNLLKIRSQIENGVYVQNDGDYASDIIDSEGYVLDRLSSEAKLKFLYEYRNTINTIQNVIAALNDPFKQFEAISCISKLLSVIEVFKTPIERRALADDIVRIYEIIIRFNLVPTILQLTHPSNVPQVQFEAVRAITFLAPGPRIASTPEDNLLHPNHMFFKRLLIVDNIVPILINLVRTSPVREVREQAIVAFGALASHNPEVRDYLLQQGVLQALLLNLSTDTPLVMLRKLSWTLSILCGVTHPLKQLPVWDMIRPALNALGSILFANDEEVVVSVCNALALLLPGLPEMVICRRLVDLLKVETSVRVQTTALRTINTIIQYDNIQTQMFVNNCSLLAHISVLLRSPDGSLRLEACETLLLLVGLKGEIQVVLNSGVVLPLAASLNTDDTIRTKAAKIIKYTSRGNAQHVQWLVDNGIILNLCKSLVHFKSYDRVLTKIYKYTGAVYNFEFARDILVSLDNIINMGEILSESKHVNRYALAFDVECIDKLSSLMSAITDNPRKEEVNAWRSERPGDSTLEERVKELLLKIQQVHQASNDDISKHVTKMINDTLKKYFTVSNLTASAALLIKATLQDDTRVVSVPRNISFAELKKGLEYKFGQSDIKLTYEDEEKDVITIDSQNSLEKAIQRYSGSRTVKIRILAASKKTAVSDIKDIPENASFGSPSLARIKKRPAMERENSLEVRSLKSTKTLFDEKPTVPSDVKFNLDQVKRQGTKQVFDTLALNTHFGSKEIESLYTKWKSQSDSGEVTKEDFLKGLKELGIADPLVLEQYWTAFDKDKDGKINFLEFVVGLSVVQRGTVEERLKFMFQAYDSDRNGSLSPQEVYNMLKSTNATRGIEVSHDQLLKLVKSCFDEVDVNHDGVITYEEFEKAVLSRKLVIDNFVNLPY